MRKSRTDSKIHSHTFRKLKGVIIATFALIFAISFAVPVFGHGFGSETVPVTIGNRNATLTLSVTPSTVDSKNNEHEMVVNLSDASSGAVIEHVTYLIELTKNDKRIFRYMFHDDLGNLYMKIKTTNSSTIQIHGKQGAVLEGWMKQDDFNPLSLEGPIFTDGGLYKFHIEIVTVDSDTKILDERITLNTAISLAEKSSYDVRSPGGKAHQIGVTTYYDKIENFAFSQDRSISFTMPFDWSKQNIEQPNLVVHEEIHIPKTFGEMLVTKYDVTVNDVPLPESSVTIDDYSDENRNVHVVLNKEELRAMYDTASKMPNVMKFIILPSMQEKFPLSANTPDLRYKVDISWDPARITAGQNTRFYVDVTELFSDKKPGSVSFDFVLKQNDAEILRKNIQGQINTQKTNFVDHIFTSDNLGAVVLLIEKIDENKLSNANFVVVVNPKVEPKQVFPIRLSSIPSDANDDGKYIVALTWIPKELVVEEGSEFIMTFYDKSTNLPVPQAEYDFVLYQNGTEFFRKSNVAPAGGSFEDYSFTANRLGQVTLRIENIDQSGEYVEVPISVTPEFPFGSILITTALFSLIILFAKFKKNSLHDAYGGSI